MTDRLDKRKKNFKIFLTVLKFLVLIAIVVAIPAYIFFYHHEILDEFNSIEDIVMFLGQYRTESILIYMGVQVLQIVISIIPGQAFQFAAGYLFGFPLGFLYSCIGAVAGTTLAYFLARFLGTDAMHLFFGEEKFQYFLERLNSKKAYMMVFLIYLIPGLPKDTLSYVAGVSDMNFKLFLVFSLMGRCFGMAGSLLIGSFYFKGHYAGMAIVSVIAIVAFFVCIIKRKKITAFIDRFYEKIIEEQQEK